MLPSLATSCYCKYLFRLIMLGWLLAWPGLIQGRNSHKNQFAKATNLEGLKVKCILKDTHGFMWFGTETGLYRYDGYHTLFISSTTEKMRLSSNSVLALYEDRQANLWIGTDNGINKLSADRQSLKSYLATDHAAAPGKNIFKAITETHDGALWCSTENGFLYRAPDKENFTLVTHITSKTKGILLPMITHLTEDARHHIWVADAHWGYQKLSPTGQVLQQYPIPSKQGWVVNDVGKNKLLFADNHDVYTYSAAQNKFLPMRSEKLSKLLHLNPHYIYQDKKGLIWIVASDKLIRLNPNTRQIDDFTQAFMQNGPDRFSIDCMYEDDNGQLWLGTLDGVYRLENSPSIFTTISLSPKVGVSPTFSIQAIFEPDTGKMLISSYSGFFEYDAQVRRLREYKLLKKGDTWISRGNPLVRAFVPGPGGQVLVATEGNGVLSYHLPSHTFSQLPPADQFNPQTQASLFNYSLLKDTDGQLWLGGYDNLYVIDPKTYSARPFTWGEARHTFSSLQIMALHQAKDQSIWVGTDNGLYRIVKGRGITHHYAAVPPHQQYQYGPGLTNAFIHCLYEDPKGHLWVGTKGGGIHVLNPANGRIGEHYTVKEGLAHDIVCAILPGKEELWISTDNGLSRLALQQKTFRNFYTRDGLPDNTFNPGAALTGRDGRLYFGSRDGLVSFHPAQLLPPAEAPQVMLTKLVQHRGTTNKIEETAFDIHTIRHIRLHYRDKFFTVYFALKDYFDYANVHQFAYKLEGFTNEWQNIGPVNYIQFAGLPAGDYILSIKGMGSNGLWGKELRLPVAVGQAIYATTGAYILYAVLALALTGIIFWFQITRMRLQNQLQLEHVQQEKLQDLAQMKTDFFTNITHEFRTPLTLIISPLEQLCAQPTLPPPDIIRQQHQVIYRNAQRLLHLINQLLDSAKLEEGSMGLTESRGDVALFVEQLIEPFRLQAEKKGIQLEYVADYNPAEYLFDAEKLEEIVYNLLANALKFTPPGGTVRLELTCQAPEAGKHWLHLRVSDTGIGIPAPQLPYVFDRFYQAAHAGTRTQAGTGLGLSLVKELTGLLGGHVAVESQEGEGTTFTITLPLRKADPLVSEAPPIALPVMAPEETVFPELPPVAADAPLVLVVEDHDELRAFVAQGLADNYRVLTATNGAEGWQLVQQELPNLVIADVAMPEMDGYTLCQLVKSTPLTTHIAVILLTARSSVESRVQGLSSGANDYLTKPFNLQELQLRVANWLSYQQALRQYWHQQFLHPNRMAPPVTSANAPQPDPFLLKMNQVLDHELANPAFSVDQLAQAMAVSTRTLHRKLSSLTGMNASDLMRSYRLGKAAALLRDGHTVSEAAYQTGFEGLSYFSKCFRAQYSVSPSEYAHFETHP